MADRRGAGKVYKLLAMTGRNYVKDALFGLSVGDALGVPVEFQPRAQLKMEPVTGMRAYGSHHQPVGTWSDDSSMAFCLAETLCTEYNLGSLASRFVHWESDGYWGAHGQVFDIGIATSSAIDRLKRGVNPILAGNTEESSNGNGSLMRILPLLFFIRDKDIETRFKTIRDVSSLTHRHNRSVIACFIYLEFALDLLEGRSKEEAYESSRIRAAACLEGLEQYTEKERGVFDRVLSGKLQDLKEEEVFSSGYVVHTLEAALWCILTGRSYEETALRAVNLGEDTDTTGAVAGGLAGLIYGWKQIPGEWMEALARKAEIGELADRLYKKLYN